MSERIAASPSKIVFATLAAFIAGVAVHAVNERRWFPTTVVFVLADSCAIIAFIARKRLWIFFLVAAAAFAAVGRYDLALADLPPDEIIPPGEHDFTGTLAAAPRITTKDAILQLDRVFLLDAPLAAGFEVHMKTTLTVKVGDRLSWRCSAQRIPSWDDARRMLRGIGWRCDVRAPPRVIAVAGATAAGAVADAHEKLRNETSALLPQPDAALLLGLLIGDKDGIPPTLAAAFRNTGTSHILAISGYNVTQLVEVAVVMFALAGIRRRRAAAIVIALLAAFAAFVGGEASVVRAAIMGSAALLATMLGRRANPANAFMLAAALMLAANPLLLRHDAGFQLSFAALVGLSAFAKPFAKRFRVVPQALGIRRAFAETLAATIATFPLILFRFGTLAVGTIVVNLFALPIVPWAMGFGAAALAVGSVSSSLAIPFALPAHLVLRLLETVVTAGAAAFPAWPLRIDGAALLALYAIVGLLWYALAH